MAVATLPLSGCIVGQMRDDLAGTRAGVERLNELAPALERSNAALAESNAQMARMYSELAETHKAIEAGLPRLDAANAHMNDAAERLRHLEPMLASLRNLDESLAALRKIIENIDKAMPLVNLTKGAPSVDRDLKRQEEERRATPAAAPAMPAEHP